MFRTAPSSLTLARLLETSFPANALFRTNRITTEQVVGITCALWVARSANLEEAHENEQGGDQQREAEESGRAEGVESDLEARAQSSRSLDDEEWHR